MRGKVCRPLNHMTCGPQPRRWWAACRSPRAAWCGYPPPTSVSKICHAFGYISVARPSFSVILSLFLNALHSVFRSDTCVDVTAYQRLDLPTGIQAQTAPVGRIRGISREFVLIAVQSLPILLLAEARGKRMASITIRNLDDDIKRRLRVRAAERGRSMEEEAREILREVVGDSRPPLNLARSLRARVTKAGGVDLDIPPRDPMREAPAFDA